MTIVRMARNTANETAASAAPDLDRYLARSRSASRGPGGAPGAGGGSRSTANGASRAHAITQAISPAISRYASPPPPFQPLEKYSTNRPAARKIRTGGSDLVITCGGVTRPEIAATTGTLLTARPGQAAAMTEVATASSRPTITAAQGRPSGSVRCAVAVSRCG